MEFDHTPVLLRETIEGLRIKPEGTYVDCTLGGGGHSESILEKLNDQGRLIGIDQDGTAVVAAGERLKRFTNVTIVLSISAIANWAIVVLFLCACGMWTIVKIGEFLSKLGNITIYRSEPPKKKGKSKKTA